MNTPRILACTFIALMLLSGLAVAQDGDQAVTMSLKGLYTVTTTNIMQTAQQVDEDLYAFTPVDGVRSMGQILAHVANAQFFFCSTAAGEENPNEVNFEETATTKEAIIEGLETAFAYCEGVYDAMTDEEGAEMRDFFGGQQMAASAILAFNSAHNYEHYGNLSTYMRMNGMVPPSSQ